MKEERKIYVPHVKSHLCVATFYFCETAKEKSSANDCVSVRIFISNERKLKENYKNNTYTRITHEIRFSSFLCYKKRAFLKNKSDGNWICNTVTV